jgi:X-Pro dipeptidyl-peptidase
MPADAYLDHRAQHAATFDVGGGCHLVSTRGPGAPLAAVRDFAAGRGCDFTPPVIDAHDVSVPVGRPVPVPAATDDVDGDVPVSCDDGVTLVTCTATDAAGNAATASFTVTRIATAGGGAGGTVPATLGLTLGSAPSLGAFQPGVDREYTTSTTANVISTAGDAALGVSDPGHLTNGAFALPEPLHVELSKTTWTAPVSNDPVTISFRQHIGAYDALRTGAYSKTLTFTLSTTTP